MRTGHFDWNLCTDALAPSPDYAELFGLKSPADGQTGRAHLDRVHPDDCSAYRTRIMTLTPTHPSYRVSYRARAPDARGLRVEEHGCGRFDDRGRLIGLTGIAAEVPAAAAAAKLPGFRADLVDKLLDASLCGLYIYDLTHGINTFTNAQYTRLTGYTLAELDPLGAAAFAELFHPEDLPRVTAHIAALRNAADDEIVELEYRFRRQDGAWIWCRSADSVFERDRDGTVRSILGTFVDISTLKQAKATLRRNEAEARRHLKEIELVYASAPVGLCVLDRDLRYVRINDRLAELNGMAAADHIGRTVREVVPALADELEARMRHVMDTGEPALDVEITGEMRAQPSADRTWIESWLPLRDADGGIIGLNIVAQEVTAERQARHDLAESRERYRLVADFTYDWEEWVGPDGQLRWVSPSCERITGHPAAAFLADAGLLERLAHAEDREALREHLDAELRSRRPTRLQFRIRLPDGSLRWMERVAQPALTADGRFAGRRASTRDITDLRRADQALSDSETRFQAIFDNAAVGIAQVDLEGRFLRVNQRLCDITGYNSDELTRLRFQDITHPDDLEPDLGNARKLLAGEISDYSMEKRYRRKDGSPVWIQLTGSIVRRTDGSPDCFIAIVDDITSRRAVEAQARTLAKVVETSHDFIGVAGLDEHALYLNRAGQELVGLDGTRPVEETVVSDYLFPEDQPFVRDTVMPTVLRDGRWAGDFRFRHFRTGDAIDVHWDVVRIDDAASGQPLQLATVTRDIRAQKATEASLREANRRKDEFLAVMGHELRNPMAPVRSAVEVLRLLKTADDPRIERTLEILDRQTAHMTRLLDDLLNISRVVRGKLKLERRPLPIGEVIEQAVDGIHSHIAQRRQELTVSPPSTEILVDGDPARLYQIVLNLLLNAANYTQEGGEIHLSAEADALQVTVRVRDNGPGIPPERLDEVFAAFYRAEPADTSAPSGLGLGLTISRHLAELHGGHLDVSSAWPLPGTEFRLHLPRLTRAAEAEQPPRSRDAARWGAGVSILLVEDNPDVAASMAMLLELLGCSVATAASGAQALTTANQQCPRLALVDIGLPDMDGLELARRLRTRYPDPGQLALVALTGYGHEEARERSFAAGFDDHLTKPVGLAALESLLERLK